MKNITRLIIGSCMALVMASAPLVGFAATSRAPVQNTMPVISGIKAPTVLTVNQMGTWTIKAFDPNNDTLNYSVDWGDSPGMLMRLFSTPVFTQTSTFTHAYVNPGTYTITFTAENESGEKTTSTVTVHVLAGETAIPPVITDVTATSSKPKRATITWNTDVRADTSLWFSTSTPVDTSKDPNVYRKAKTLAHKINLTKLEPDTTYYVVVGSKNADGMSTSTETSFVTPQVVEKNAPVITGIDASTTIAAGEMETLTVNAYDPKNTSLSYDVDWGDMPLMMARLSTTETPFTQTSTFTHTYENPGTYTATVTVTNEAGMHTSSSVVITVTEPPVDETAPVISDISTSTAETSATISWATDEPSSSNVFYSTTSPVDIHATSTQEISNDTLTTNHSVDLPDLESDTKYYFLIQSADESDNTSTSDEMALTTTSEM